MVQYSRRSIEDRKIFSLGNCVYDHGMKLLHFIVLKYIQGAPC